MAHKRVLLLLAAVLGIAAASVAVAQATTGARSHRRGGGHGSHTATPIKHVVVIFQENESFDHYFGTYPKAANTDGRRFRAAKRTPPVDGLRPATSHSQVARLAPTAGSRRDDPLDGGLVPSPRRRLLRARAVCGAARGVPAARRNGERGLNCRFCGAATGDPVLQLGAQPPANSFLTAVQVREVEAGRLAEPRIPLDLHLCSACGLVQIAELLIT